MMNTDSPALTTGTVMNNIDSLALAVVNPIYSPALTSTYLLFYSIPIRANKKLPFIE
jgi:hypothetical protein